MKTLLTITTLVFTVMFSTPSYSKWTEVNKTTDGQHTFYVDFERIRKHGSSPILIHWWELLNKTKPNKDGVQSSITYKQGDCFQFRFKVLSVSLFTTPMGTGEPLGTHNIPDKEWRYPLPNTINEDIFKRVCWKR
jgi:hypothetical protein